MNEALENNRLECIATCRRLADIMEHSKDTAHYCFNGQILQAYREATDRAIKETKIIIEKINNL